jgi:hypothetical protein
MIGNSLLESWHASRVTVQPHGKRGLPNRKTNLTHSSEGGRARRSNKPTQTQTQTNQIQAYGRIH